MPVDDGVVVSEQRRRPHQRIQLVGGAVAESVDLVRAGDAEGVRERSAAGLGGVMVEEAAAQVHHLSAVGRTLRDGLVEEAAGERRGHHVQHGFATGRLAEDRDVARVATEGLDVRLHPFEGGDLVEGAVVAGDAQVRLDGEFRVGEVAHEPEPVVDQDRDHAFLGQCRGCIERLAACAVLMVPAVDPDHHRQLGLRIEVRGAHGQV